MTTDLEHLRQIAKRLERYATRTREKLWQGDPRDLIYALADCAEAHGIARRLYRQLQQYLQELDTPPPPPPLQDDPRT